ncbi:hypothetical protein [Engelhardtia mirabilis]|uniref:Uncharacterized protein n=1 Tax=Engelhardtia mirabilis TaxID=2528011 RepID=A0A518BGQ7_9BACT|nr:hypothetical protein Pla133_12330 [Planctomycetes bacterium Pla133]QDV00494.1 hypothetical protein Pla86_12330 [Planctomycetes bacterium Pla86]
MNSVEGIDRLHMSGARAVFVLEPGSDLDQAAIAAAFEDRGMQLESLEYVQRPRARGVVTVDTGVT